MDSSMIRFIDRSITLAKVKFPFQKRLLRSESRNLFDIILVQFTDCAIKNIDLLTSTSIVSQQFFSYSLLEVTSSRLRFYQIELHCVAWWSLRVSIEGEEALKKGLLCIPPKGHTLPFCTGWLLGDGGAVMQWRQVAKSGPSPSNAFKLNAFVRWMRNEKRIRFDRYSAPPPIYFFVFCLQETASVQLYYYRGESSHREQWSSTLMQRFE